MRIAVIADIHGNRIALDAVLADLEAQGPYEMVCLGDVAALGPQPQQALRRLHELGCPAVMGNTDEWLLNGFPVTGQDERTHRMSEVYEWGRQMLSESDRDYLRTFRPRVDFPMDGGHVLLCFHGSPSSNMDVILSTTPDDALEAMLSGSHGMVLAGGHTHVQMLRRLGRGTIINPGSVGLPGSAGPPPPGTYRPPWAEYATVGMENGALSIEFRRVPVDVAAVVQAAFDARRPHADAWAAEWGVH